VTAAAQDLARRAGVPVAEVVAVGVTSGRDPVQYLVQEQVEGTEWRTVRSQLGGTELARASTEIAQMLLRLQTVTMPSFGGLADPGSIDGSGLVDALRTRIDLRIRDDRRRTLARQVLEQHGHLFRTDPRPTLTHDDLHHANLLFRRAGDGWHLVAVLDWDKAWAGSPECDLARMAFWDDMADDTFWSVYRASVPPEQGAAERAMIYQLLWCLEYEATTTRHRSDTAALVAALT
jgi:aminoglycoside phosphotransferase (APT) family kinase protein